MMAQEVDLASLSDSAIKKRLARLEERLRVDPEDPETLQYQLDLRAEVRRRQREKAERVTDGELDPNEDRRLRDEAKADAVLRTWVEVRRPVDLTKRVFDGVDTEVLPNGKPGPTFSVQEVAKAFFARSAHWIRWRERNGDFTRPDGSPIGSRTDTGSRSYTLADIEDMAHALAANHSITPAQLALAVTNARNVALMFGMLVEEE